MSKPARFITIPTVSDVVRRAVKVVDPAEKDPDLAGFEEPFEDDDEPVAAAGNFDERLGRAAGAEALLDNPRVAVAVAIARYLRYRRDEIRETDEDLLRLAARAEWDGRPPDYVRRWLDERGVKV